jgi:hypothetical protein
MKAVRKMDPGAEGWSVDQIASKYVAPLVDGPCSAKPTAYAPKRA